MARHYLDHASTAPLRPEARAAVMDAIATQSADPGRLHEEGLIVRHRIESAREKVADFFGVRPRSVVFTSGATESVATAVWGALAQSGSRHHVVVPAVEHAAVRRAAFMRDHTVTGVDRQGRIDPDEIAAAIRDETALVHVQMANQEVGTIQPVDEVIAMCRERDVLVHVDAAAAAGRIPLDVGSLGADLVSISSHKMGGPVGVGALLVRRGLRIAPLLTGGDQERSRRAGLENLPGIAGFAAACEALSNGVMEREAAISRGQAEAIVDAATTIEGVNLYGPRDFEAKLPHLVCIGIEDVEPQAVLLGLDRAGIAAHSGAACSSESLEPSPVLEAMGVDAQHSLRLSVGWDTDDGDVQAVCDALPRVIADLRTLRT